MVDPEDLDESNVIRHVGHEVGEAKVRVVARRIRQVLPAAKVRAIRADICSSMSLRHRVFDGIDCAVASTDSYEAQAAVADECWRRGIPHVICGCHALAHSGEIAVIIPGKTPCFRWYSAFRAEAVADTPKYDYRFDPSRMPPQPALALDINLVANIACHYVMALLEGPGSRRYAELIEPLFPSSNVIWLSTGTIPGAPFRHPFEIVPTQLPPDGCTHHGT